MAFKISGQEYLLLKKHIYEQCGIFLGDNKEYLLETRLVNILIQTGCQTFGELYLKLKYSSPYSELSALFLDAITTNETLWFRDKYPFRILEETIFPVFLEEIESGKRTNINIWSAGCSTGQEPYSIAIVANDFFNSRKTISSWQDKLNIIATDLSQRVLSIALSGVYDDIAMKRGMLQKYIDNYFNKERNLWILDEKLRKMVQFKIFNFKDSPLSLRMTFDIIFLRNVIIYFSDSFKQTLFDRISKVLSPGGYLFLGTGETASGYSDKFEIVEDRNVIYYRLKKS